MKKALIFLAVALIFCLMGCSTETQEPTSDSEPTILIDDDVIKASFVKVYEESFLEGSCFLQLLVENKSEQPVYVFLADAYVNDVSVMMGSSVPMNIEPGKKSQNPFTFSGFTLDEVDVIEFKISVLDENFETIEETETLKVNPQET